MAKNEISTKVMDSFLPVVQSAASALVDFLPDSIDPERFLRTMNGCIKADKYLTDCLNTADGKKSLLIAFRQCAMDGLFPDGKREAAIIAFKGKATYIPMYGGLLKRMRNSGEVKDVQTGLICKNDVFDFQRGTDNYLHHKQALENRGEKIGAWALVTTTDGGEYFDVMGKDEILEIKKAVKARSGPWFNSAHEGEMWRKTALRRASKLAPLSSDVQNVFSRDDTMYDFSQTQAQTPADRLNSHMADKAAGRSGAVIDSKPSNKRLKAPEKDEADSRPSDERGRDQDERPRDNGPDERDRQREREPEQKKSTRKPLEDKPDNEPDEQTSSGKVGFPCDPLEMSEDQWVQFTDDLIADYKARKIPMRDFDKLYGEELNYLADQSPQQYDRVLSIG